jgi:hypothetical protein
MLSEYLPHVKSSRTKITLKGPLVFPVLERILSEDKDIIEFQVKHPSEIGVNGLFDVNISSSSTSPLLEEVATSSSTAAETTTLSKSLFVDPLKRNTAFLSSVEKEGERIQGDIKKEEKVKEEQSEGHNKNQEQQQLQEQLNERQPCTVVSSPVVASVMQLPSMPLDSMITHNTLNHCFSSSDAADDGDDEASDDDDDEEKMQTEDKDIKSEVDNTSHCKSDIKGNPSEEEASLERKEEESPPSSRRPSTLDIMTGGQQQERRKKTSSAFSQGVMIPSMISSNIVSPDTPRPNKSFSQQYLNGHAYTYIGLKVSTRSTYCCIYRPQPMFVPQETSPKLSMYSNWQTSCSPVDPLVTEVSPKGILASYDSRLLWKHKENDGRSNCSYYVVSNKSNKTLTLGSTINEERQQVKPTDDLIMTDSKYWYNKIVKESTDTSNQLLMTQQQVVFTMDDSFKRKLSLMTVPSTGLSLDILTNTSRKISNCEVSYCFSVCGYFKFTFTALCHLNFISKSVTFLFFVINSHEIKRRRMEINFHHC